MSMSKKTVCQILESVFGHLENIIVCFQILENVFGHLENILGCFQIFSKFARKVFPDGGPPLPPILRRYGPRKCSNTERYTHPVIMTAAEEQSET